MGSKTKTSSTSAATTTPTTAEPYGSTFVDYTAGITDFLGMDPTQFVAPTSQLQQQAIDGASNLGAWQGYLDQAGTYADAYADAPATQVDAAGYYAPQLGGAYTWGGTGLAPASQYGGTQLGQASQYGGTQLGQAAQMQAGQLGQASTYRAPTIGGVAGPTAYRAGQTNIGNAPEIDARRTLEYMNDYRNPYTQEVIDSTLADFDEYGGQRMAAQDADAAKTKAFGGSRYGIAEAQLEGELARGRASTAASLRDQQFKTAAQLGQADASMAGQADMANRDAQMQFAMAQFGVDSQAAGQFANAMNMASQAGYQGNLQTALTQAGFDADSARYYSDAMNQFAMQQGQMNQQASQINMGALNDFAVQQGMWSQETGLANTSTLNNFMMQQGLLDQQTGQMNMDALNQFAMQQGLLDQQTGQMNMEAMNNFLMTQVGLDADASKYYADALNQASFANANLQEQSYQRMMEAGGMYGDMSQFYGAQSLNDLNAMGQFGTLDRSIQSEYMNAYPTQLQLAGNLYSQLYPGLYSGTNQTGSGTSTQKTSGLGTWLPQLAGAALTAGATVFGGPVAGAAAGGITFSDRRLKTNIRKIGEYADGLGIYEWNWKTEPDGPIATGVIADEVKELRPWAYIKDFRDGYDGVNYATLNQSNGVG